MPVIILCSQAYRKSFHVLQENWERLEVNGTHQLLVYADDHILFGQNLIK
jgi:hypothetical protein